LYHVPGAVVAVGHISDPATRANLKQNPNTEWSLAWPTGTAETRKPTAAELGQWPDAQRVITRWFPTEISPVTRSSCGPSCRTISAKGSCSCGGVKAAPARPDDLVQWLPAAGQSRAAAIAIHAGMKKWGIKSDLTWRFFLPNGRCAGQYLCGRDEVWIQRGLDVRSTAETALHELRHHRQHERGEFMDDGEAEGYARVLVADLVASGDLEDAELEAKYAAGIGIWQVSATASESAYYRWDDFASRLYQLLVVLNNGVTTARIDDAGWWDRLVATYGDRLGRNAGSTLTPEYSRQTCINSGLADLWSRWGECAKLEAQLGTQFQTFRSARGALATPTSVEMLRLMPPRIPQPVRGET